MTTPVRWPDTFGYTIFCDDIRQEKSNKRIFIGVYQGRMIVFGSPPINFVKLAVAIYLYEKPGETEPIEIVVTVPGLDDPFFRAVIPAEARKAIAPPTPEEGVDIEDARIGIQFDASLSPVPLAKDGFIKVRAIRGDKEFRLGALQVQFAPPDQAQDSQG